MKEADVYAVRVRKRVWATGREAVEAWREGRAGASPEPRAADLARDLELPFAPFPGLALRADGWRCPPLASVEWVESERRFVCAVPDEHAAGDTLYDELVSEALDAGWRRAGGYAPGWVGGLVHDADA